MSAVRAAAFNRQIRVGDTVDVTMDEKTGQTLSAVVTSPAVRYLGDLYVVELRNLGLVAIQYVHLPPGVQG